MKPILAIDYHLPVGHILGFIMTDNMTSIMNSIGRKLAPIRPKSRRLWKIVEQYEMMNHVDKSLIAKKKKQIGKTIRLLDYSTILTTIGVLALCALL